MDQENFARVANERYTRSRDFWQNWRVEAVDDYAFISGDQWLSDDRHKLDAERRPTTTFNYSEKMIDAVVGAEVSSRQETSFLPRGLEDAQMTELVNAAAKWTRDECHAEDEESDAFRDMLICGLGWTWTRMSYDEDPDGKLFIERVDPLEMYADPAARKPGLIDRRWQDRVWWVDNAEVARHWPDAVDAPYDSNTNTARGVIRHGRRYSDLDRVADDVDRHKDQTQIRLHECYELEPYYRVAAGNQITEMSAADFEAQHAAQPFPEGSYVKQQRRIYYRAFFAGDSLLEVRKSPCQSGFTFQAITGKRDRNANTWYGLTRVMKDPQRWANKWLAQILHIINSNAKGGLMAEIGAFVDPIKAQEEWSKPDSITLFHEGALSGKKVQQKQAAPYPAGLDKLMEFALGSLPMVTGINLEALGLANREQAGVLEQQRKQAAYGLLAPLFDALRRYRKTQGRILLEYIDKYLSDGRLIRIGGPEAAQYVPLLRQEDTPRYDIIVDQSPNAPDTKQKTWETLVEIIPAMLKAGLPLPPDLLDYTPLPASLVSKWKQFVGQQQQMNEQTQQQMQQLQQENDALKSNQEVKIQELEFEKQKAAFELDLERQKTVAKLQMERESHQQKMALEREKAAAEFDLEAYKQDRQFDLEGRRLQHEASMKETQLDNDFKVKAFAAGAKASDTGAFKIDVDAGELPQLLQQFAQASTALATQAQAGNDAVTQAVSQLVSALSRPRKLLTNAAGQPVGSVL